MTGRGCGESNWMGEETEEGDAAIVEGGNLTGERQKAK